MEDTYEVARRLADYRNALEFYAKELTLEDIQWYAEEIKRIEHMQRRLTRCPECRHWMAIEYAVDANTLARCCMRIFCTGAISI